MLNACFLHGDFLIEFSGVLTLGPYCLLHTVVYIPSSTYLCSTHGLSSTEGTTVPWRLPYNSIYIVPLLCSTYSTHGAVKYWGVR